MSNVGRIYIYFREEITLFEGNGDKLMHSDIMSFAYQTYGLKQISRVQGHVRTHSLLDAPNYISKIEKIRYIVEYTVKF